jgi:RNA recognition motif-containing protein
MTRDKPVDDKTRLFIGGLLYTTTKDELIEHFQEAGTVTNAYLPIDRERGNGELNKGFAFVNFNTPLEAETAIRMFDGQSGPLSPEGRSIGVKLANQD